MADEAAPPPGRRRLAALVVFGAAALAAAAAASYAFSVFIRPPDHVDPGPMPKNPAPFITTPDRVVDEMVRLARLGEDDLVYDLGCGDGRIVVTAAAKSGCRGVGFDIDPERVAEARENAKLHGVEERVEIVEQDVFTVDLSEADCVMTYLLPWMMNDLVPQFEKMKPGSRIVAHEFWIDGVVPDEVSDVATENRERVRIYRYDLPLRFDPTMEKGKPPVIESAAPAEEPETETP